MNASYILQKRESFFHDSKTILGVIKRIDYCVIGFSQYRYVLSSCIATKACTCVMRTTSSLNIDNNCLFIYIWVYFGVKTCEILFCFGTILFLLYNYCFEVLCFTSLVSSTTMVSQVFIPRLSKAFSHKHIS